MRRLAAALVAGVVLLGACAEAPMSRAEAGEFTARALQSARVRMAGTARTVEKECGRRRLPGWSTTITDPDGSSIEVCVYRRGDRVVYVRDVGPGGAGPLLTDQQFRRLERFRFDPVEPRRQALVRRMAALATVLLAGVVAAWVVLSRRRLLPSARSS